MWILKGTLLGVGIFVIGGISYTVIRLFITMYQTIKTGAPQAGGNWDIRGLIHIPILWAALLVSVAIGLWIAHGEEESMSWVAKGIFAGLVFFAIFTIIYLRGFYSGMRPHTAMIGVIVYAITRPLYGIILVLMVATAGLCFKLLQR
jgi:hypothetical protein